MVDDPYGGWYPAKDDGWQMVADGELVAIDAGWLDTNDGGLETTYVGITEDGRLDVVTTDGG